MVFQAYVGIHKLDLRIPQPDNSTQETRNLLLAPLVFLYVCYRTYRNAQVSLTRFNEPPHCPDVRLGRCCALKQSSALLLSLN